MPAFKVGMRSLGRGADRRDVAARIGGVVDSGGRRLVGAAPEDQQDCAERRVEKKSSFHFSVVDGCLLLQRLDCDLRLLFVSLPPLEPTP